MINDFFITFNIAKIIKLINVINQYLSSCIFKIVIFEKKLMLILRRLIFISVMILLGWLFIINLYEIDIVPVKNGAYQREQVIKIEESNSISELKTIAKSKVITIQKIHKSNVEKSTKELYILFGIISMTVFLYLAKKPIKTHNS